MRIVDATPEMADMRTVVLVGSSYTRKIKRDGVKIFISIRQDIMENS